MAEQLLYTVREAQEVLRLSRTKIKELIASGELRSVKIGRARRIPVTAAEQFVAELKRCEGDG